MPDLFFSHVAILTIFIEKQITPLVLEEVLHICVDPLMLEQILL